MAQAEYNYTNILNGTSTGNVAIPGPVNLHAINVTIPGAGAAGALTIYNGTSSAAVLATTLSALAVMSFQFDIVLPLGLFVGSTTSTGNVTIAWA